MGDDRKTDEELDRLQWTTVLYYLHETNPDNALLQDSGTSSPLPAGGHGPAAGRVHGRLAIARPPAEMGNASEA